MILFVAVFTAFMGLLLPFFGGLLGFFGGLAFASTSYIVSNIILYFIMLSLHEFKFKKLWKLENMNKCADIWLLMIYDATLCFNRCLVLFGLKPKNLNRGASTGCYVGWVHNINYFILFLISFRISIYLANYNICIRSISDFNVNWHYYHDVGTNWRSSRDRCFVEELQTFSIIIWSFYFF